VQKEQRKVRSITKGKYKVCTNQNIVTMHNFGKPYTALGAGLESWAYEKGGYTIQDHYFYRVLNILLTERELENARRLNPNAVEFVPNHIKSIDEQTDAGSRGGGYSNKNINETFNQDNRASNRIPKENNEYNESTAQMCDNTNWNKVKSNRKQKKHQERFTVVTNRHVTEGNPDQMTNPYAILADEVEDDGVDIEKSISDKDEEYKGETETWRSLEEDSQGWNSNAATRFDAKHLSAEDMEEILSRYNEMHPDRSPGAGIIKYAKLLEEETEEQKDIIDELKTKLWYSECNTYIEQSEKRMLDGEVGVLMAACHHERQQCELKNQEYHQLLDNYNKLDGQYDKLWMEYEDEKEHFYHELKKMEHCEGKEEERRCKSRYKRRKGKR